MEEFDYPGIRVMLEATLDKMRQPIKIDISTDDVITPRAIEYDYKLMFEDRTISVLTYNKETLLAEKMQTIINRGIANTRLRDFYDVYSIMSFYGEQIEKRILYDAFSATCEKRKTIFSKDNIEATLHLISDDLQMEVRSFSLSDVEEIKKFRDRFRIVAAGSAANHDRIFFGTVFCKQRNPGQIQHLQDVCITHFVLQRDA